MVETLIVFQESVNTVSVFEKLNIENACKRIAVVVIIICK
jgi:hypothetical protein